MTRSISRANTELFFRVEGDRLEVNIDSSKSDLRVEVLDEHNQPISGYDATSCKSITADSLQTKVQWRGETLKGLRGQSIHLRFHLTRAKLFAFQVK